ncbi:MAG TPA: gamma-glutamyltransferase family protein, partial [Chloroflexota bacterium]
PYPSRRSPVVARHGIVATSQPLAAQAGLSMLQAGGTAVDAAIATAAIMTVVEPTSNGIGSDAFALIWDGSRLHGYNGSGRAPTALTPERVRAAGLTAMPGSGWLAVTVPGAPRTWADLNQRFGKLDLEQVLAPAIATAREGYAVTPVISGLWAGGAAAQSRRSGPEFDAWWPTFAPTGQPPAAGDIWASAEHAETLMRIAKTRADDFYRGELAQRIADFAHQTGGLMTADDLAQHTGTWVEPISTNYRGYDVWEIPPNGQGLAALIALNLLEHDAFGLAQGPRESVDSYHVQIEAMKLAFADAHRYIADPEYAAVPTQELLAKDYAASRRALIGDRAEVRQAGDPVRGGTIYLCAADQDGMMVSYIQSNYAGFGSGVVVPGTGIALQNRGSGFSLDPNHPNVLEPGKRPFHTIIPAFLTRDGEAVGPFGVMGGHMQPQGHLQVVLNTIEWGMNPQAALDAPRWMVMSGLDVLVEPSVGPEIVQGLQARGHQLHLGDPEPFGRGQIIWRLPSGALVAGTEPRADGAALGY